MIDTQPIDLYLETCLQTSLLTLPPGASQTVFTVSGGPVLLVWLAGEVTTAVQNQACTLKFTHTDAVGAGVTNLCTTVSIIAAAVGTFFTLPNSFGTALMSTAGGVATIGMSMTVIPAGTISSVTSATNTGAVRYYLRYIPLRTASVVTAS